MSSNPYAAPNAAVSEVVDSREERERMARIASGQRMMVWSVLGMFVAGAIARSPSVVVGAVGSLLSIACVVCAIIGAVRLARALGTHWVMCVIGAICMILPLINLITMLLMSSRATRALRAAGYQVGLMGARDI